MTDSMPPLERGETLELDTGTHVTRGKQHENRYEIRIGGSILELEDEELRMLAELAGYDVTDPDHL